MKSIYEFKKGDIVTRVAPAKALGKSIFNPEGQGDRSYQGDKLVFVGIANGCIYLKRTDILELKIFGDKLLELPLDIFSDGWNYWVDPYDLLEDGKLDEILISKDGLKEAMAKAIAEENYEAAAKFKKLLNKHGKLLDKDEKKKK